MNKLKKSTMIAPFGRVGGKSKLKIRIVNDYFPEGYENMIYVEPFVGAGSIFFYKQPSIKEVINDLDTIVYDLLKGFQKYDGIKIKEELQPKYTKEEFYAIKDWEPRSKYQKFIRSLILTKTSFFQMAKSFSKQKEKGMNPNFEPYQDRLKDVIILNKDYKDVIKKYDSPNTFFYLDPPYENSHKLYTHDTLPIKEVYDIVKNIKGKFLISYNDSQEARKLFKNYNISYENTKYRINHTIKKEMLISNY
jgi:DNA adenine methylase